MTPDRTDLSGSVGQERIFPLPSQFDREMWNKYVGLPLPQDMLGQTLYVDWRIADELEQEVHLISLNQIGKPETEYVYEGKIGLDPGPMWQMIRNVYSYLWPIDWVNRTTGEVYAGAMLEECRSWEKRNGRGKRWFRQSISRSCMQGDRALEYQYYEKDRGEGNTRKNRWVEATTTVFVGEGLVDYIMDNNGNMRRLRTRGFGGERLVRKCDRYIAPEILREARVIKF